MQLSNLQAPVARLAVLILFQTPVARLTKWQTVAARCCLARRPAVAVNVGQVGARRAAGQADGLQAGLTTLRESLAILSDSAAATAEISSSTRYDLDDALQKATKSLGV